MNKNEYSEKIDAIDSMINDLYKQRTDLLYDKIQHDNSDDYVLSSNNYPTELKRNAINHFKEQMKYSDKAFKEAMNVKPSGFLKDSQDLSIYSDKIFALNDKAKNDKSDNVYNATLGILYDENKQLYTFNSVYNCYNKISDKEKASYAQGIEGNKLFNEEVFKQVNQLNNINLPHKVVATPGGSGAIFLSLTSFLNSGEEVLLPKTAWSSYALMSKYYNLNSTFYDLVDKDNKTDLTDLMLKSLQIIKKQHKLVIVINDPCQNPTGICLGANNWKILIEYFNRLKEYGQVIIVNDIAYIDYSYQQARNYLEHFNSADEHIAIMIAYSCSKSLTAYGMRLGANIILHKNQEIVDEIYNSMVKACRATWSNVNNAMMNAYTDLMTNNYDEYFKEREQAINLLKERSSIFIQEANKCDLPLFPYTAGFFITIKIDQDDLVEKYHQKLIQNHIYTVKSNGGIRVSICGLTINECKTLPQRMKDVLKECQND